MTISIATSVTHVYFRKGRVYNNDPRNNLDCIAEFWAKDRGSKKRLADYPIDKIIKVREALNGH